MMTFIQCFSSF